GSSQWSGSRLSTHDPRWRTSSSPRCAIRPRCSIALVEDHPVHRRIDRVRDPAFIVGLGDLSLDDLRDRRDECMAEREYLSLLRRLLQGRAEILQAKIERSDEGGDRTALDGRLK